MTGLVTFDLFSALVDSRRGGSAVFASLAARHGWPVTGEELYDAWDPRNKAAQGAAGVEAGGWVPWRRTAEQAVAAAYDSLGVTGDPAEAVEALVASLPDWPLWPDAAVGLTALAGPPHGVRVGLLSNVDDDLFRRTAAAPLVDHRVALTSERLGAAKPNPEIYRRAVQQHGPLVHVATSARDVRGALEAGIPVIRLERPGHRLDPDGPTPAFTARSVGELPALLERLERLAADEGPRA